MPDPALYVATIPDVDAAPKDAVTFSIVSSDISHDDTGAIESFVRTAAGSHAMGEYLARCMDRTADACTLKTYALAGHLDGSPHGSPVASTTFDLPAAVDADNNPNQCAAVLAIHADGTGVPESGGTGTVKTPESAIDYGAPATHTGVLKLKSRYRGRIFWGPLVISTKDYTAAHNPILASGFITDAAASLSALRTAMAGRWCVWSRTDAAVRPVTFGWVDHGIKTRRRREYVPNVRTTWS